MSSDARTTAAEPETLSQQVEQKIQRIAAIKVEIALVERELADAKQALDVVVHGKKWKKRKAPPHGNAADLAIALRGVGR